MKSLQTTILFLLFAGLLVVPAISADREGDPKPEGEVRRDNPEAKAGPRDGERGEKAGPRDGERGEKAGPRDGERGEKAGPRDGERGEKAGPRDGERGEKAGPRDGEGKPRAEGAKDKPGVPANAKNQKEAKMFLTYDKEKNGTVSDEEIAAMREGKLNSRGKREIRKAVDRADKDEDGVLNYEEFVWWLRIGRADERARNR